MSLPLRVLLVEDNQNDRTILRDLLEFDGHVLDEYEVARRLLAALGARVTLVAASGCGQPDDVRRAHDAGFDAHLVKPIDLDRLRRLLATVRG